MDSYCLTIQNHLEKVYDIPFSVADGKEYNDPFYIISPKSEMEELFSVRITFRQKIRMIVEILPQKYAANMIWEIQHAEIQKRKNFQEFFRIFRQNNAKIDLYINKRSVDETNDDVWLDSWKQFRIRSTKIIAEEDVNNLHLLVFWAELSIGTMLSLLRIEQMECEQKQYSEGKVSEVLANKYERNPINRKLCLIANGYSCKICGFNFEKVYGAIGREFIHVHHIELVSSFGGEYYLDPVTDMIPVCPNCHAMLHTSNPPLAPEVLRQIITDNENRQGDCF